MNTQTNTDIANGTSGFRTRQVVSVGRQPAPKAETKINVEKDGDQVTKIVIQCSCGEQTTIQCKYPNPS